jgi:AraC-like DNA-binding protein
MTATDLARRPSQAQQPINESAPGLPAPALRPYIAHYSGYRQAGVPPALHAGLPSPYLTVIFTLDEPLAIAAHPDPAQPGGEYLTLAGGLHTAPALITHEGYQSGIQLAVSALASRALLGVPASELVSIDVEGTEVYGGLAIQIQERIRSAASWPERFAVLDEVMSAKLAAAEHDRHHEVSAEVRFAWERLLASGGTITVSALAAETGWSPRHLRARFAAEIGLSPKAAARVVRFDRTRRLLQRRAASGRPLDLAALAASCGYYDQAHLDGEFRSLAGSAPTTWLIREFRNLQAGSLLPEEA